MNQLELISELTRRKTKRDDLLAAFERKGELTTGEVLDIAGTGMSSRLKELRKRGHIILPTHERGGTWRYTYIGQRDQDATKVSNVD